MVLHFEKHGNEFKGIYNSVDEYLQEVRDVMNNGYKVEYYYKGETRVGYVEFMKIIVKERLNLLLLELIMKDT